MRGGAQAHLMEAEDGCFYVVKFANNPQHRRILVNEMIAGVALRYLQIAAPETAIVSLSPDFLAVNHEVCIQLGTRRIAPAAGWHFGSRFPGDPERLAVYDFLPDALLEHVDNLSHFLGVLVADKWMGNADGRQSIYFRARLSEWTPAAGTRRRVGFVTQMIDQGFVFNGPNWEFADAPLQGLALRPSVYRSVRSLDDFQPWLDQVAHFPEEVLDQAMKQIPPQWIAGEEQELEKLLEKLLARRRRVADMIVECRRARVGLFPNWIE